MKDSSAFVECISQTTILKSDVLVSFDVVSLFTRVPVDEALDVISKLLLQDETLPERTTIAAPDLCRLIELCLKSTYFRFGDTFYEQVEGAAMGSPLSPIVANLYMEALRNGPWTHPHRNPISGLGMWMMFLPSGHMVTKPWMSS